MVYGQELQSPVKVIKTGSCIGSSYIIYNIATCKIEDATNNEKVKVEPVSSQYVQDDQVIIVCDSEYHMVDNSEPIVVRICMSDRTWSGIDPHCEKSKGK